MIPSDDGVYALRYATRSESRRGEHFYTHSDHCVEQWPIHYYTWVILRGERIVVVDAGFTPAEAERRGSRDYEASPLERLAQLGIGAERVQDLVLTHLHYDHTGFVDAYPNAVVHVQRSELDFWRSPMARRGAFAHLCNNKDLAALDKLEAAGRLRVGHGDVQLDEAVSLHLVGGHTAGTQVVRALTSEGAIVLASDASHFYANFEQDAPYAIVHELPLMYRAFDRLRELAGACGVIVPGHDPEVPTRHKPILANGGITRLTITPNTTFKESK